jgi:hypothetical protein
MVEWSRGERCPTGEARDERYHLPFELDAGQGRWRIDLSVWLRDLHGHVADWHTRLRDTITDEQRLAVLRIKDVWYRLPSYPDEVGGWEIYTAVLGDGIRTRSSSHAGSPPTASRARTRPCRLQRLARAGGGTADHDRAGLLAGRCHLTRTPRGFAASGRPRPDQARLEVLVGHQAPVDGVRQPAFQAPQRLLR